MSMCPGNKRRLKCTIQDLPGLQPQQNREAPLTQATALPPPGVGWDFASAIACCHLLQRGGYCSQPPELCAHFVLYVIGIYAQQVQIPKQPFYFFSSRANEHHSIPDFFHQKHFPTGEFIETGHFLKFLASCTRDINYVTIPASKLQLGGALLSSVVTCTLYK